MEKKAWIKIIAVEAAITVLLMVAAIFPWVNKRYSVQELQNLTAECVRSPGMFLGYGTYKYTIEYDTDSDNCFAFIETQYVNEQGKQLIGHMDMDAVTLLSDRNTISGEVFIRVPAGDYSVYTYRLADARLDVNSVTVQKTAGGIFKLGIIAIFISAVIDLIILYADRRKKGLIHEGSTEIFFVLFGTILFVSVPLYFGYLINGHDLQYHLLRIEGIKDGLLAGDFPIKIQSNWLKGNGYATAVFYGDLFLYIPAILRLCGFSIVQSYNIYVFLCNAATCVIAYFCFKGMSGRRKTAAVGAVLYTTSIYRLLDVYVRSSVGEYSAMAFLPMIAYGLWKIYNDDCGENNYKRNWIIPVLGFTGIINTHTLTCEMVAIFVILLCIIFIKKTFKKERFIVLVKIVLYTTIINLAFFVPFFHYMLQGGFVITSNAPSYIQQYGAFIGQLFAPTMTYSGLTVGYQEGIASELPLTTGLGLVMGAVALIYSLAMGYVKDKKEKAAGIIFVVFSALSLWFSTYLFPWDYIQNICRLFMKVVSTMQFPWRFLSIASIMLALCAIYALKHMDAVKKAYRYAAIGMLAVAFLQAGYFIGNIVNSYEPFFAYGESKLDTTMVVGAEYLPAGILVETYDGQYAIPDENINYVENYRKDNYIECTVQNDSDKDGAVVFSIVYYDGYTAIDKAGGQKLDVSANEGRLSVNVPSGYSGDVVISFTGFASWKIATVISILAAIVLVIYIIDRKKIIYSKLSGHLKKNK